MRNRGGYIIWSENRGLGMMKFLQKFSDSIMKRAVLSSSGWRISMYSSERSPNLYDRLVKCYRERVSVIPVLDEWVAQVGDIRQQTLQLFITNFTKRRRFTPALHVHFLLFISVDFADINFEDNGTKHLYCIC